ncbi:glycosyltransferase family A protein [Brevibacillus panacihumi]|uniref:glycosyltransferase family A protein n=1 Tax=Brevibacillus panacihumi TaxID=497735 RepID=UPI001FE53C15|nr:glycosyltransferase family A protein [Brevibacillus panacihumi]
MLTSVVIPTRDVADQLLYTLFCLNLQLTSFDDFEVIVIDNASTDDTQQKVAQFAANYSLRYVRFRRRLPFYRLVNEGVVQSRGSLVLFLASNLMVPREFIGTHMQAHLHDPKLALLGLDFVYDRACLRSPGNLAACRSVPSVDSHGDGAGYGAQAMESRASLPVCRQADRAEARARAVSGDSSPTT